MNIHPRHSNLLFALFMSLSMAFIMSGVLTAIYHGFEDFISNWMYGFSVAWPIAFPAVLVIAPRVRRVVQRLTSQIQS
jgi:hypothetical protein